MLRSEILLDTIPRFVTTIYLTFHGLSTSEISSITLRLNNNYYCVNTKLITLQLLLLVIFMKLFIIIYTS